MTISTLGSAKSALSHNERAIRTMRRENHHCSLSSMAVFLRVQSAPVADDAAYTEWLADAASTDRRGKLSICGRALRRAVIMRRQGATLTEAARAIGMTAPGIKKWLDRLPPHLAVSTPSTGARS